MALRSGDLAAYHGVEHKAIAGYEDDSDAAEPGQGARPLRLAPGHADARRGRGGERGRAPGRPARSGGRGRGGRSAARRWRWRCSPGPSATRTASLARLLRKPGHEIQRVVGTREPTAEQLEVGRAALGRDPARRSRRLTPWPPRPARARASTRRSSGCPWSGSARATTRTPTSTSRRSCSRREGRHPRVTMQVFQKHDSVLGGIDEAIAVLKQCSGRATGRGGWQRGLGRARGAGAPRGRRDLALRARAHRSRATTRCSPTSRPCTSAAWRAARS